MGDTIAPKKVIFVDRDGTLLAEPADEQIDSLEKCRFVSGAISGMKAIAGLGYELVMVGNEPGRTGHARLPGRDLLAVSAFAAGHPGKRRRRF